MNSHNKRKPCTQRILIEQEKNKVVQYTTDEDLEELFMVSQLILETQEEATVAMTNIMERDLICQSFKDTKPASQHELDIHRLEMEVKNIREARARDITYFTNLIADLRGRVSKIEAMNLNALINP